MRNIILLFVLFGFSFSSCKEKTIVENEIDNLKLEKENFSKIDTTFYKNKKIKSLRFYKTRTEYMDVFFYKSGKKKSVGSVKNNQCHEEYVDWYENGKMKWTRKYNFGEQIGKSINYRENGNLEKQYDNERKEFTDFWENGKTKFKFVENGFQYYYYLNGNLMEKYDKIKDNHYLVNYFSENGENIFSGIYKSDILYKDGKKYNGKIICYFMNGKISRFEEIKDGIPDGKIYGYYGNGVLKFASEFSNGKEIFNKSFYENGKVNFIRDRKNNKFTQWDEKGNLIE